MHRSRILGMVVGFVAGAAIGLGAMFYLYGRNVQEPVGWTARLIAAFVIGAIGAFLGMLSGLGKG